MYYIFVDLDECLLHTECRFIRNDAERQELEALPGHWIDGSYCYTSILRGGALELLAQLRSLIPEENVIMLTTAMADYADHWNMEFGLGFKTIISRDVEHRKEEFAKLVQGSKCCLIDNLKQYENEGKIWHLEKLAGERPHYIQVREFLNFPGQEFTQEELDSIVGKIKAHVDLNTGTGSN